MKVLITGANGQLGQSFQWLAPEAQAQGIELIFADRQTLDITSVKAMEAYLGRLRPDAVVNTAAYTAVDKAESEPEQAFLINGTAPGQLARVCRDQGAWLLHVSTDYVFDGSKQTPYVEGDHAAPLGVYGASKLEGEGAVLAAAPDSVILRTSWVFSQFGHNFFKTMLRLAKERDQLSIVSDQIGGPTYAPHIAQVLLQLVSLKASGTEVTGGIYHFGGVPHVSWYEFAGAILEQAYVAGLLEHTPRLVPIGSHDYPTPAKRPANSRLASEKLAAALDAEMCNDWQVGVELAVKALISLHPAFPAS